MRHCKAVTLEGRIDFFLKVMTSVLEEKKIKSSPSDMAFSKWLKQHLIIQLSCTAEDPCAGSQAHDSRSSYFPVLFLCVPLHTSSIRLTISACLFLNLFHSLIHSLIQSDEDPRVPPLTPTHTHTHACTRNQREIYANVTRRTPAEF